MENKKTFDVYRHFETNTINLFVGNTAICRLDKAKLKSLAIACKFNCYMVGEKGTVWELIPKS